MPYTPQQLPQRHGVSRDHRAREARQRAARADFQGWLPPHRRPGKERVDDSEVAAGEWDLGYQSPEGVLKDVFTGDSDSGDGS
jgi:hypothetical protein